MARRRQAIRCTAHRRDGSPCKGWALPGQKVCYSHGAASPQALAAAGRRQAEEAAGKLAARLAVPVKTTAAEALADELDRLTGLEQRLDALCAELHEQGELAWGPERRVIHMDQGGQPRVTAVVSAARLHPLARLLMQVTEQRVRLALGMKRIDTSIRVEVDVHDAIGRELDRLSGQLGTVVPGD